MTQVYQENQVRLIDPCDLDDLDLDLEEEQDVEYARRMDEQMEEEAIEAQLRHFEINYCM